MGFKRHTGTAWQEIGSAKRYDGSVWLRSGRAKRWDGSKWVEIWNLLAFRPWNGNKLGDRGYLRKETDDNGETCTSLYVDTTGGDHPSYAALVTPVRNFSEGTLTLDWDSSYSNVSAHIWIYQNEKGDVVGQGLKHFAPVFKRRTDTISLPAGTYQLMIQLHGGSVDGRTTRIRIYQVKIDGKTVPIVL